MEHLDGKAELKEEMNAKDLMTKYTLAAIASCGFGMEINSFTDENNEFARQVSVKRTFSPR